MLSLTSRFLQLSSRRSPRAVTAFAMSSPSASAQRRLGTARILAKEPLDTSEAKWLTLSKIKWSDQTGKERVWETAGRKTTAASGVDAVAVLALLQSKGSPTKTVLVCQYRPPVGAICVELPAGLVDEGESIEQAALRELHEETGYGGGGRGGTAVVTSTTPIIYSDPGMSSANMSLVIVNVTFPDQLLPDQLPEPQLEPGEHIQIELVQVDRMHDKLLHLSAQEGWAVDARLMHLSSGLHVASQLAT